MSFVKFEIKLYFIKWGIIRFQLPVVVIKIFAEESESLKGGVGGVVQ